MTKSDPHHFLEVATSLAERAAQEVILLLKDPTIHHRKADDSIVTLADLKSDAIILEGLLKNFPDHAILSEETGLSGKLNSEYVWMIDPLDGTKAYAKEIPGFCVMIGLLKNGEPYLGVVADPLEGHVYQAIRGQGAFHLLNGKKTSLKVSKREKWNEMPAVFSPGFPDESFQKIQAKIPIPFLPPINSVGIKVGLLVRQVGDLYLNHHPVSYWDTCAPQIILEEAGGVFTQWDGSKLNYDLKTSFVHSLPTLASNGVRHEELVESLKDILTLDRA